MSAGVLAVRLKAQNQAQSRSVLGLTPQAWTAIPQPLLAASAEAFVLWSNNLQTSLSSSLLGMACSLLHCALSQVPSPPFRVASLGSGLGAKRCRAWLRLATLDCASHLCGTIDSRGQQVLLLRWSACAMWAGALGTGAKIETDVWSARQSGSWSLVFLTIALGL